jgi:hypothetical protein
MSGADERFERALGGDPPFSADDELAAFVRDVRDAFPAEPVLAEEVHLQAIVDAARRISAETQPPMRKEPPVRFPKFRSRAAMVVAGFVVVMTSFGGLAVAGALPGAVQDRVANAVTIVNLPGGDDESSELEDDATETESPEDDATETDETNETEAPKADDKGENERSGDDNGDDRESEADNGDDRESEADNGDDRESEADDEGENERSGDDDSSEGESGEDESD